MADAILMRGTVATVIIPEMQNGVGHFPSEPGAESADESTPAPAGLEPDTDAIAQAAILHLRGNSAGALQVLTAVDPAQRTADLLSALGYVQAELHEYAAAAQTYSELAQMQPSMAEAWFQWGFCLYRLGETASALQKFDRAAALRSDWIEIPLARAVSHLRLKQYQKSFECADECLAMNPAYGPALFAKAVTFHVMWEFDQALALYTQIIEADPASIETLMNLITLGLQQKQYATVRRYSEQLIALQPDIALAVEGLAIAAFNDGDYATAVQQFSRLLELAPEQPSNWLNLGVSHERRGDLPEAIAAFTKARQLRPDSLFAHTYLGGALFKSGDLVAARYCYQEAVRKWPDREELTLMLAQILEDLGSLPEAEQVCAQYCERDSSHSQVWFHLGYVQYKREHWDDAIFSFDRALALKPDWPEAEVDLALAAYMSGKYDQSEAVLRRLLEREPEHLEGLKGLATVTLAQGRHEEALKLHVKVLAIGGPDADAFYNCGVLAYRLQRHDSAADYYRQAISVRPAFAEALLNLGHALNELGRNDEAHSSWISALELRPEFARGYFRRA